MKQSIIGQLLDEISEVNVSIMSTAEWISEYTYHVDDVNNWTKKFCLIPRRCALTNRIIWLKSCSYGTFQNEGLLGNGRLGPTYHYHVVPEELTVRMLKRPTNNSIGESNASI